MPQPSIQFDKRQLDLVKKTFSEIKNGAPRVIVRSLNKTAAKAKTEASKEIRKVVTLKAKTVKDAIKITKPNFKNLSAKLTISGRPLPLINYGLAKNIFVKGGGLGARAGIKVKVRKNRGIEKHPNAFFAQMKSGHKGIYERKGKKRLPIEEKAGPSIPAVFQFNGESKVSLNAANNLQTNLDREIAFLLSKIK